MEITRRIKCRFCEKDFSTGSIDQHILQSHLGVKKNCKICNKSYTRSSLSRHIKETHGHSEKKKSAQFVAKA